MVIDMHPHAKVYSFLWSASLALIFSFAVVQLFGLLVPPMSAQLLGLMQVVGLFILWRAAFGFFISHCVRAFTLNPHGFLLETLTDEKAFVDFSQLRSFRVRSFGHRSLLTWSYDQNGVMKKQFVYFSLFSLEPHVVEQFNLYLQHNIGRRSHDHL